MIQLTPERLDSWKQAFAKDGLVYETDDEYREAVNNLIGLFDLLIKLDAQQKRKSTLNDDDPQMYLLDDKGVKIIL